MLRIVYLFISCLLLTSMAWANSLSVIGPNGTQTYNQMQLLELNDDALETTTPWTDGVQQFKGAHLSSLLERAGISEGTIKAVALNGYSVDISVAAALTAQAYIASYLNDAPMRVRDKGPFWIVFPWSMNAELDNSNTRTWSIWQLERLEWQD